MKKLLTCALILALCLGMWTAAGAEEKPERVILYTAYVQMGWGDRIEMGCVDEEGGLWTLSAPSASQAGIEWPAGPEDQLAFLTGSGLLTRTGELSRDEIFDLKSLIVGVGDMYQYAIPVANDAGEEVSWSVDYDRDGAARPVRLGMSGDDRYENTDPDAQALYARLRTLFPGVTCYSDGMGPAGFQPVKLYEFCSFDAAALADADVKAAYMDCEAGPNELELDAEDVEAARRLALEATVTGKANGTMTTGGTVVYSYYDRAGNWLCSVELYQGLLVMNDGMYALEG